MRFVTSIQDFDSTMNRMSLKNWRRKKRDSDLEEEVSSHLELAEREALQSGRAAEDARASARREFGNVALAEELTREAWGYRWFADLLQDLRYAFRTLRKTPGFTSIAILTIALGIGATTSIFSIVKAVLLDALPYRKPMQLVTLAETSSADSTGVNVSFGAVEDWKVRQHSFESIAIYRSWTPTLLSGDSPSLVLGQRVTQNFFPMLGVRPAFGRAFRPEDDHANSWHVLLLSHPFWIRQFGGDPNVVGRKIILDRLPFEIVGVLPQRFEPTMFLDANGEPDVWAPLGYEAGAPYACRTCQHVRAAAMLRDGVKLAAAQSEMNSIAQQLAREFPKDYPPDATVAVAPLRQTWLGKAQSAIWMLFAATGFVLLIACVNVANLLLARAPAKRREIALRTALGAARSRIIRQLLTESALLSVIGGALGFLLANWFVSLLVRFVPGSLPRIAEVRLDSAILILALAVSIVTGILVGLTPAVQLARIDQREAMQQSTRGTIGARRGRFRESLIAAEVSLAFILTIVSLLLLKSFVRVLNVDPGFDPRGVYTVNFALEGPQYNDNKPVIEFERQALQRIQALPGIQAASIVSTLPIGGSFDQNALIREESYTPDAQLPDIDTYDVSPGYFAAMRIPLLRGRLFTQDDTTTQSPVVIVSESAAKTYWPGADPIGRHIQLNSRDAKAPWATIIGIVGDVRQFGLDSPPTPEIYALYTWRSFERPCLVIRTSQDPASVTRMVEREIWALDRNVLVWNPFLMSQILHDSISPRRFTMSLLTAFGVLAVLLAAVGIYGVMSFSVVQRTREIGVRMALGARPALILRMVLSEIGAVGLAGLGAGVVAALALTRLITGLLYGVGQADPWTYTAAAAVVACVSLLACSIPARRATRIEPSVALRVD